MQAGDLVRRSGATRELLVPQADRTTKAGFLTPPEAWFREIAEAIEADAAS